MALLLRRSRQCNIKIRVDHSEVSELWDFSPMIERLPGGPFSQILAYLSLAEWAMLDSTCKALRQVCASHWKQRNNSRLGVSLVSALAHFCARERVLTLHRMNVTNRRLLLLACKERIPTKLPVQKMALKM